jgi:hypothetical protein
MNRQALFLVIATLVAPSVALAQTQNIDRADAALSDAWTKSLLTVQRAVFVTERPGGYGIYKEHASEFKPGEPLITYAEPVAFGYRELGKDAYEFGFTVDVMVKTADGKVLAGQESFAKLAMQSHRRNREFMLTLTMDVAGLAPGSYKLEYRLHDISGNDKSTSFEQPFSIVK